MIGRELKVGKLDHMREGEVLCNRHRSQRTRGDLED